MSPDPPTPVCPRCGRGIAAWKMDHCVYCGAPFPPDWKEGLTEPEALKWVERPGLPPEAARQLEMMKVVPFDREKKPRMLAVLGLLSIPVFAVIFYLLYSLVQRYSAFSAGFILVGGLAFLIYLVWSLGRTAKS